jgi:hypothetical protein
VSTNTSALSSLTVRVDRGTDDAFIGAAGALCSHASEPERRTIQPGLSRRGPMAQRAPKQITTIVSALSR